MPYVLYRFIDTLGLWHIHQNMPKWLLIQEYSCAWSQWGPPLLIYFIHTVIWLSLPLLCVFDINNALKTYILPSIQHDLIDSGRCKMYKRATSKEQAFLRLFHMHFSIHSLTIQTSLSLQNGNITVVRNKYTIVHDCHNHIPWDLQYLQRTISRKQCVWYVCVYIYQVQLLSYDNNQKLFKY